MKQMLLIGGSRGIGRAIAQTATDFDITNLSRTPPDEAIAVSAHHTLDVLTDPLPDLPTPLDALIYCPGSINLKPLSSLSPDDFRRDFEINVLGAVRVLQKYLPNLKAARGNVVLFSTVATQLGMPYHASVAASKAAVEGLTKSLAAEWAGSVRINCIAPTITETPLAERLLKTPTQREQMAARHPLKNFLQPNDVASMVAYLISDQARFITGQTFVLDAGLVTLKL